ncbi:MAG: hypothetical protein IRY99_13650 [Isosphaeraceae bacterium]|nr:hypothetical protein [Isosphaeraceae bacterium]
MAGLLVSVRSDIEARAAWVGGAAIIDVKEPARGPLGRAEVAVWQAVRAAVPPEVPVSVALGELAEWRGLDPRDLAGISYCKLGLAGSGPRWEADWAAIRAEADGDVPWIAVAYADWQAAGAPPAEAVLDAAWAAGCAGILVDTWDKSRPSPLDLSWASWVRRARAGGLLVALAGGLDEAAIARLAPLEPDLFAVRGAACGGGDRRGTIEPERVARLVEVVVSRSRVACAASRRPVTEEWA